MRGVPSQLPFGKLGHIESLPMTLTNPHSQLEAIIRISESLAKLTLSPVVHTHHVDEAIRLFKFSTMDAVSAGSADGLSRGELNEEMTRIEKELRRRLPVGWSTSYQSLVREFVTQQQYSSHALERTLFILEKREIIRFSGQVRVCVVLWLAILIVSSPNRKKSCTGLGFDLRLDFCFVFPIYMLFTFVYIWRSAIITMSY
jgi:hypothetical protein